MTDSESSYKVGPGRPPLHSRFRKGQSGTPGGRSSKSLPALLADALNETVVVTIDGRRRKLTKREAIVAQMVDKIGECRSARKYEALATRLPALRGLAS